jgi:hypothetical protein
MVGVDVGQKRDPTAVCVLEVEERPESDEPGARTDDYFIARYLSRLPLGTPYPRVADRLAEVLDNLSKQASAEARKEVTVNPTVYIDATGVGAPLVDLMKDKGVKVTAVFFNYGDRCVRNEETHGLVVGKAYLVSRLQILLQSARILLPKADEARALAEELETYEIKIDEKANERYGAFSTGTHDDLATSLGLAVIAGQRRRKMLSNISTGTALVSPSKWYGIGENGRPDADQAAAYWAMHPEGRPQGAGLRQHDPLHRPSRNRIE